MKNIDLDICEICKVPKTIYHIFFQFFYANEIWNLFWNGHDIWGLNGRVNWKDILMGFDIKISKELHLFYFLLMTEIMWVIWKARNEDKYSGVRRILTESNKRFTFFNVAL